MNNTAHNQQLFASIFDASPFAIVISCALSNEIVAVNNKCLSLLSFTKEELIGESFEKLTISEINNSSLLDINNDTTLEIQIYNKAHKAIQVQLNNTVLEINGKSFIMSTIIKDEVNLKAEQNLIQKENQYKSLFNNSINGIALFNMEKRKYTECNAMFSDIYGYTKEELLNLSVLDLVWEDDVKDKNFYKERFKENYNSLKLNQIIRFESIHKTKSAEKIYVQIVLIPFEINGDLFIKQVTTDVTMQYLSRLKIEEFFKELQEVNLELNESNQLLESFAYIISHDLREPIRTIVGLSQLVRKGLLNNNTKNADEFIGLIENAGRDLNTMIDDILAFSKVKKSNVNFQLTDVSLIIEKVLLHLRSITAGKDLEINVPFNIPDKIIAHNTYLYQVFQNIIKNAVKFRKKEIPCIIDIFFSENETHYQFSIKDNGIGIPKESFKDIFKLFNKLHKRKQYKGTGIGLTICQKIIDFHEGEIWLESELGKGTCFYFTIKKDLEIAKQDKL